MNTPRATTISVESNQLDLHDSDGVRVVLRAVSKEETIKDAGQWVVLGSGYRSSDDATEAAARWRAWLMLAFARTGIGVDFGDRAAKGQFTKAGLAWVENQTGERVLNDVHGTVVYECDPAPKFASTSATAVVGRATDRFVEALGGAKAAGLDISAERQLAYELYSASFFATYADARYLLLMMALETLIDPQPKSDEAQGLVDRFIDLLKDSGVSDPEAASLRGSLNWLRDESISQAGRRLARTLGERRYMDHAAESFFIRCYDLRSNLAHGHHPRPGRQEVDSHAAELERFVGDLLSIELP